AELLLQEIDGMQADKLPRLRDPTKAQDMDSPPDNYPVYVEDGLPKRNWTAFGIFEPIPPADIAAAGEVWRQQNLAPRMVADFTADAS
ncbi:hypothetical protein V2J23_18320, partial [Geobacillus thermoleovorans]|uniref:hypothetical protein n=1 Tax=Geobacillus thermoleovorans TaxID=33941 RepID=UPI00345C592E